MRTHLHMHYVLPVLPLTRFPYTQSDALEPADLEVWLRRQYEEAILPHQQPPEGRLHGTADHDEL